MRALGIGILAAILLAGPKLFGLVQDGSMSGSTAMLRGGVLAVACAVGVSVITMIMSGYRPEPDDDSDEAAADAADAAAGTDDGR